MTARVSLPAQQHVPPGCLGTSGVPPALQDLPSRLFVETTSRCNLNCFMCMKQAGGGSGDGDLSPVTFDQDCYLNGEPCGACLWRTGMFQCLS
jgi:hypothetical protein